MKFEEQEELLSNQDSPDINEEDFVKIEIPLTVSFEEGLFGCEARLTPVDSLGDTTHLKFKLDVHFNNFLEINKGYLQQFEHLDMIIKDKILTMLFDVYKVNSFPVTNNKCSKSRVRGGYS